MVWLRLISAHNEFGLVAIAHFDQDVLEDTIRINVAVGNIAQQRHVQLVVLLFVLFCNVCNTSYHLMR